MPKIKRDWIRYRDPIEDNWLPPQEEIDQWPEGPSQFYLQLEELLYLHFHKFPESDRFNYSAMAHCLCYDQAHLLDHFWSISETQENITKLKAHLISASKIWEEFPLPIQDEFRIASLGRTGVLGPVNQDDPWLLCPNVRIDKHPSYHAYRCTSDFFDWLHVFLEVFPDIVKKADEGTPHGKKSLEAWRLVAASAALCERLPNTIKIPKYMNESGPFYRLLSDLFDLFELEELPTSAFRGWRKHVGQKA